MDFLFAKNESFNIASIQHEEGGGKKWRELLPIAEEMHQEHMKRNATMMNKGGGQKQKDPDMTMNKKNEGKRGVVV
jgi:hypothetical protein